MNIIFLKDPTAVLDYTLDWTSWLGSDTLSTVTWTIPSGLTNVSESHTTTSGTVWLSGGTEGTKYLIQCTITTAGGRTDARTFYIKVETQ